MEPLRKLANKYRSERDEAYTKADELYFKKVQLEEKLDENTAALQKLQESEAKRIKSEKDALSRENELQNTVALLQKHKRDELQCEKTKTDVLSKEHSKYKTLYNRAKGREERLLSVESSLKRRNATLESEVAKFRSEVKRLSTNAASLERQLQAEKKENSELQNFAAEKHCEVGWDEVDDDEDVPLPIRLKIEKKSQPRKITDFAKLSKADTTNKQPASATKSLKKRFSSSYESQQVKDGSKSATPSKQAIQHKRPKLDSTLTQKPCSTPNPTEEDEENNPLAHFTYQAVLSYTDEYISSFEPKELPSELQDIIKNLTDKWEDDFGDCWYLRFSCTTTKVKSCLNTKLYNHRGKGWRPGGGEGKWACHNCVGAGLPCFVWTGEEFWLLPVHEDDRRLKAAEGFEIRYWIDEAAAGLVD